MRKLVPDLAKERTLDLPGVPAAPKCRGRKPTGTALTNAQRLARYRARHKHIETGERIGATITALSKQFDLSELVITRELLRFALCNQNWKQTGFPSLREAA